MVRVDAATHLWSRVDISTIRECPPGAETSLPRITEDADRGEAVVAGGVLVVVEGVVHMWRAGEAVGVAPGCDIGVEEVVSSAEGSKWLKMS